MFEVSNCNLRNGTVRVSFKMSAKCFDRADAPPLQSGQAIKRKERPKAGTGAVIYPQGQISEIPEDFPRKELFMEIDKYQGGWTVELQSRAESDVVDAVFFAPSGEAVGQFSKARRLALAASKAS